MGIFFVYILKSSVCLTIFYLFYKLLLSRVLQIITQQRDLPSFQPDRFIKLDHAFGYHPIL